MTDELLKIADVLVTDPIDDAEAAFICADWHGGQWSNMYGYQSSGILTDPDGIALEAEQSYREISDDIELEEAVNLLALYQWAMSKIND